MTVKTTKTGQQLREQVLKEGPEARMRAIQALSYSYSLGSEAALANLLLAALGGNEADQPAVRPKVSVIMQPGDMKPALLGEVALPMMQSANDDDFDESEVNEVS